MFGEFTICILILNIDYVIICIGCIAVDEIKRFSLISSPSGLLQCFDTVHHHRHHHHHHLFCRKTSTSSYMDT